MYVAVRSRCHAVQIIMAAVDKPRKVSFKGTTDLVTETDKNSEEAIIKVIRQTFPHHGLLGEEGGVSGDVNSEYLWCIDPLDGTTKCVMIYAYRFRGS